MNCAQVKEQLVDFLYGELSASARATFAEHLRGCPGCSAEVASHGKTIAQTRAALAGPLAQEPPARVHAAVLEAAQAAAKQTRRTAAVPEPGFFTRLWRTPWLLPAFGAASVAAVVFLVRVLKNPEVLPGQRRQSIAERAVSTPEPAAPPPRAEPAVAAAEAKAGRKDEEATGVGRVAKESRHAAMAVAGKQAASRGATPPIDMPAKHKGVELDSLSGGPRGNAPAGGGAPSRYAEPPPPRAVGRKASRDIDDLMKSFDGERKAAPAEAQAAKPAAKKSLGAPDEESLSGALIADEAESTGRVNRVTSKQISDKRDYAMPPPAPAPAAAPAPATPAAAPLAVQPPRPSAHASAPVYAPAGASASPAPPASPSSPTRATRSRGAELAEEAPMAKVSEPIVDDEPTEKAEKRKDKAAPSLEASIRKADHLFANQDWATAAEAYRDLLRRFPGHKDAPKWRDRVSQALVAEQESRKSQDAKAAKTKASDVLLKGAK